MKRRIFYNGIILTMNKAEPTAEYVLTEGDKVAAVGSAAEIEKHIAEGAEPVNLQGRLMLPGFIDSHIHMLTAALNRLKLDISAMEFDTVMICSPMFAKKRRDHRILGSAYSAFRRKTSVRAEW